MKPDRETLTCLRSRAHEAPRFRTGRTHLEVLSASATKPPTLAMKTTTYEAATQKLEMHSRVLGER